VNGEATSVAADNLEALPWDSAHFGFPVARITCSNRTPVLLRQTLAEAREIGICLVYVSTEPEPPPVPPDLLGEFTGLLVDRKVVFALDLGQVRQTRREERADGVRILDQPRETASAALVALAIEAGMYSRFRVDPRVCRERCDALFETWMQRSTMGPLADGVLLAVDRKDELLGTVTLSIKDESGNIGLIAVADGARGRGIGSLLLAAAHQRMIVRGATRVTVVTQLANRAACRLYEQAGYRIDNVKHCYHFWPQAHSPGQI
jgi:dTDP-4-amino-4,6-dideoxy-D-galactose acyltransferase